MNSEVVSAPNWLRELEEKRELKLKARLGHEAGAGSPCLECKEKCPGLDLHFWRKICKICKCGKENHGVHDNDFSDWLQFQLLGSKTPKKVHKIKLSGPNELELDWTPKGSKEAVERYLKDLPAEQLPIKGSNAARERKQLLQKQMPIHDIDPSLCHALSEEETKRMEDYLSHLKETSVGQGQLLNFQSPVPAKLVTSKIPVMTKHDYENIDAFGNHKLAASLEAIRQKRRLLENGEVLDEYGNPARAQYAMLLDKSGSPLKDPMGKPIKATLDLFGNPIFDAALVEKISPIAKAEFAMLLDKNGAPILGVEGNPVKKPVQEVLKNEIPKLLDKFGNEVKAHSGLLLDRNHLPIKDKLGSPIKVRMDVYGRPIFDKVLSEVMSTASEHGPKYIVYLDKNSASILGPDGSPLKKPIGNQAVAKFAIFLNDQKNVLRDKFGDPITTYLDVFKNPIIDESTLEDLNHQVPLFSVLLDEKGEILESQNFNAHRDVIVDKFDNELRPQYGLLLDEHECPMKDQMGSPIKVPLDHFLRPRYEPYVLEKLGPRHPEYVMFLDRNGAAILDKYGSPIKNIAYSTHEPLGMPQMAILLDKNEKPLKDPKDSKVPLRTQVDILGRPLDEALKAEAKYSMPLDQNGVSHSVCPINYLHVPRVINSSNNSAHPKPQWSSLLSKGDNKFLSDLEGCHLVSASGVPVFTPAGSPVEIRLDHYGYPIMQMAGNGDIQGATLHGKAGPILDKHGLPVRIKVDRNGATVEGIPIYLEPEAENHELGLPPVVDKYGNLIDPRTGRPLVSPLPNFASLSLRNPMEDVQDPCQVNVGMINDINALNIQDTDIPRNTNSTNAVSNLQFDGFDLTYDLPVCHRCKNLIEDNAVVIQIDRSDALWHTSCFKCKGCNQHLQDLYYYYHKESDDVYCGRDYAKMRGIPRCHACDELIFVSEYCLTEDMTYHVKHFCCFECDTPLAGQDYVLENSQPVCIACYELLKADRCTACGDIIRPNEQGANLNGDHFHASDRCFACRVCAKPLLGGKFLYRGKVLYCSGVCFNSFNANKG